MIHRSSTSTSTSKSFKLAAALCLGAFVAAPAFAQSDGPGLHSNQFYVGGSLGSPDWRTHDVNGIDGSSSDVGGKVYGGYSFNPYFSAELGGVWLGHLKSSSGDAKAEGGYLDAVGTYPITPKWALLGRVGIIDTKVKTPNGDDSGTNWKYGAGVQYNIDSHYSVRAEAEHYMMKAFNDDPHVNLYSVGLNYAF